MTDKMWYELLYILNWETGGNMEKDNIWDWHKKVADSSAIDKFLESLKQASSQPILLPYQRFKAGDVNASVSTLLYMVVANPKSTEKVVKTMLEMDKYLQKHYGKLKEWNGAERLFIPVALDALEEKIEENVSNAAVKSDAMKLVNRGKESIKQDESADRRNTYDTIYSGFKNYMTESERALKETRKQYVLPRKNTRVI